MSAWDLVIVGAGPAGAAAAILAARRGYRVAVLDAAHFPRQKVCGEYLTSAAWQMLDRLGVGDLYPHAAPLTKMWFTADDTRAATIDLTKDAVAGNDSEAPRGLSRWMLDARLVDEARRAGASLFTDQRVRSVVVRQGQAVAVDCAANGDHGSDERFEAPLIIAADGRRSIVVRETGRLRRQDLGLLGFKRHVRAVDTLTENTIAMHALRGGYLGTCPTEDGLLNVCGVMPKSILQAAHGNADVAFANWLASRPGLHRYVEAQADESWIFMPDVSRQTATPSVGGVMYLGDARGTIEPLAGQGMTMALASAFLADEHVLRHGMQRFDVSPSNYHKAWTGRFTPSIRYAAWFGRLLRRPRLLAVLLRASALPQLTQSLIRFAQRRTQSVDGDPALCMSASSSK